MRMAIAVGLGALKQISIRSSLEARTELTFARLTISLVAITIDARVVAGIRFD